MSILTRPLPADFFGDVLFNTCLFILPILALMVLWQYLMRHKFFINTFAISDFVRAHHPHYPHWLRIKNTRSHRIFAIHYQEDGEPQCHIYSTRKGFSLGQLISFAVRDKASRSLLMIALYLSSMNFVLIYPMPLYAFYAALLAPIFLLAFYRVRKRHTYTNLLKKLLVKADTRHSADKICAIVHQDHLTQCPASITELPSEQLGSYHYFQQNIDSAEKGK